MRRADNWRTRTCFCGNPLPAVFAMAWCDSCLDEYLASDENPRMFIRRKEVANPSGPPLSGEGKPE